MAMYEWILQNKEILKFVYALLIGFICLIIVIKTNRLFQLSLHQGIRYFRNAFFFYGIAFIIRYFFGGISIYNVFIRLLFEYCLIMAGFSLLYSLLWKKFEGTKGDANFSSLFNVNIGIFYALASIIIILDYLWNTYFFMFLLQITVFSLASLIGYIKYIEKGRKYNFIKLYLIVIILNLIAWILNFIVAIFFEWNLIIVINIYILNIIIFFLFLYGIFKVTKTTKI